VGHYRQGEGGKDGGALPIITVSEGKRPATREEATTIGECRIHIGGRANATGISKKTKKGKGTDPVTRESLRRKVDSDRCMTLILRE